jgi:hypothetical protein
MYHIVCPEKYRRAVISHGDEEVISRHVKNQGRNPDRYEKIYENRQFEVFA